MNSFSDNLNKYAKSFRLDKPLEQCLKKDGAENFTCPIHTDTELKREKHSGASQKTTGHIEIFACPVPACGYRCTCDTGEFGSGMKPPGG